MPKRTEEYKLKKYKEAFEKFQEQIENGTIKKYADDEEFKHCIDDAFGVAYYGPFWVVSNYGRVFSLRWWKFDKVYQKPETPNQKKKSNTKYYYVGNYTLVHKLVAIYFCDRTAIEKYGIDKVQVDHYIAFDANKPNEINNYYKNLFWTEKSDHKLITDIDSGKFKNGKVYNGIAIEVENNMIIPKGSHFEYRDGKKILIQKIV